MKATERAEILVQALPYIRKYTGKIVVIKYGGNAMTSESLKQQVMEDIVLLRLVGVNVVLVHGGGPRAVPFHREGDSGFHCAFAETDLRRTSRRDDSDRRREKRRQSGVHMRGQRLKKRNLTLYLNVNN